MEVLGDYRDLSVEEWNFKELLKNHLLELLEQHRIFQKQRGAVKWIKFGDAGTSFFHASATIRHRGNSIAELVSSEGAVVSDHRGKEQVVSDDFKFRLGTSEFSEFTVNPSLFIQRCDHLELLEASFTQNEIDSIIKALPNDKSPGPDGFIN